MIKLPTHLLVANACGDTLFPAKVFITTVTEYSVKNMPRPLLLVELCFD